MNALILFQWSGEAMVPLKRFASQCDDAFVIGELYRMDVIEERSQRSHAHMFACIHDCWLNLPDHIAMQFPTPESLRKHALIMTGYRDERKLVASSPAEARKIAAFIRPQGDDYAIVSVNGNVVIEWRAKSQSRKAMGGPTFQKSKEDVLNYLSDLLGVERKALEAASG